MIVHSRYVHCSVPIGSGNHYTCIRRNVLLNRIFYLNRRGKSRFFREVRLLAGTTIIVVIVSVGAPLVSAVPAPKVVLPPRKVMSRLHYTTATWYGPGLYSHTLRNGERYPVKGLFAAHRTLPIGTVIKVTNLHNGKSVVVTVLDRGPYYDQTCRGLDLSIAAARSIGMLRQGVVPVSWVIQA